VAETLLRWGRPDQTEAAVLLTSELVTNAIVHARTQVAVTVQLDDASLRVVVVDESAEPPNRREGADHLGGGRGLRLVEALAASWGVSPEGHGKAVWFELA